MKKLFIFIMLIFCGSSCTRWEAQKPLTTFKYEDGTSSTSDDTTLFDISRDTHKTLVSVIIGNQVERIGKDAFFRCRKLSSIKIPEKVESIGDFAFAYTSLKEVIIPKSVTSLGSYSFLYCTNLTNIKIPQELKDRQTELGLNEEQKAKVVWVK